MKSKTTRKPQLLYAMLVLSLLMMFSYLLVRPSFSHAATVDQCAPAAGLGTATNGNFSVTSAGSYKFWVRMKAASPAQNLVSLQIRSGAGATACFPAVGGSDLSVTTWQWKLAGEAQLTTAGNSMILAGKHQNVLVDRVIPIPSSSTCDPNAFNTRNTSTGVEPGDGCLQAASPSVTTSAPPPTTTVTPPTTTVTPAPTVTPPQPTVSPVGPPALAPYLYYDWIKGRYYVQLNWSQATGTVTSYEIQRNGSVVGSVSSNQRSFADYSVNTDVRYTYQVFARNDTQRSAGSPQVITTIRCFFIFCGLQ